MSRLPTGTVTFLFTDIEGSTRMLQQLGYEYAQVLSEYRRLLRAAFHERGGHEVDTRGEESFVAFAQATDAVAAAVAVQVAIAAHSWPAGITVRVRVGLHTGEPLVAETGYVGIDVHRAARICAAGHGGQILLSDTTRALVENELPESVSIRDLGKHRLKDLTSPQHLFQIIAPSLSAEFPPLKSLDALPNNLPAQPNPLIGREREVEAALPLLRRKGMRLLTFTGPGGIGKTRLALQVGADLIDDFQDGVYYVALESITELGLVASTIAQALNIREEGGRSILESLKGHLREKQLLLMLDNFEQVLPAAQLVAELLAAAPRLKVLVTSRAVLHIRGEQEFLVPPLPVPDPKRLPPVLALCQYAGVALFVERALNVNPDFAVSDENAAAVAEICFRLEGLPLALELAAARLKLLAPHALLGRLESRLKLLTGGPRDLPTRQQTLRSTIAWSYDLLEEAERTLFRRLSVFVGGWVLGAAEVVCNPKSGPLGALEIDLLHGVASLVDKSLLRVEEADGESRFGMLETIREFGLECLTASGEEPALRRRHALCYLGLAEKADHKLVSPEQQVWLDRLERDHDNLRAAVEWFVQAGEAEKGLRLGAALWRFSEVRGYLSEERERLKRLLAMPAAAVPPETRLKALEAAGILADAQSDYAAARTHFEEHLEISRKLGDNQGTFGSLHHLGNSAMMQGDYVAARSFFEESLTLSREYGYLGGIAWPLKGLGDVMLRQGDYAMARSYYEQSLVIFRESRLPGLVVVLNDLANVTVAQGDYEAAQSFFEQTLEMFREQGNSGAVAVTLNNLGNVALRQGNYVTARSLYEQSLKIALELRSKGNIARLLEGFAGIAAAEDRPQRAFRLAGAAAALRRTLGAPLPREEQSRLERSLEPARRMLPDAEAGAAWAEGEAMQLEQTIDEALERKEKR